MKLTKIQLTGLGLIVICGALSQWTAAKESQTLVWILAIGAVVGVAFVVSDYFSRK
ncbi:hypothetical protein [Leeuwenhoekiella parthenopeia]|uniref:Uncharacterized protein n=1 Tax=Leeuwenhoekiella parthenopeia TaxID=2890320 RepID=A0ABS8GQH4_9FLAO|nr:hypothetical protein [Leeuwenhoekiella parthenopeia]MCC4212220.1 hypothetical protein [Leeuwenhoekiella parthenopeia]